MNMEPGAFYHVFNRGNNRETIFKEDANYAFFLRQVRKYLLPHLDLYAYCLMPNHFHLLVQLHDTEIPPSAPHEPRVLSPVEKAFKNCFISYAKAMNKRYGRVGSLFQTPYKRREITSERYLGNAIAYIHLNPVTAALADRPEDWPHSSYAELVGESETVIPREKIFDWFGGKDSFIDFHRDFQAYRDTASDF